MNWDQIQGKWKQVKGDALKRWGELTDNEYEEIRGNREQFVGKLQERYGESREEINRQIDEWADRLKV